MPDDEEVTKPHDGSVTQPHRDKAGKETERTGDKRDVEPGSDADSNDEALGV